MLRLIDWKYTPLVLLAVGGAGVVAASLMVGALSGLWWLALPFVFVDLALLVGALAWGWRYVRSAD